MRPLVALVLLAAPLSAQGYRYSFHMTSGDDRVRGTVTWIGDRGRIDVTPDHARPAGDDYLLLRNGGRRILSVHPEDRAYSVVDDTVFERIVGWALQSVDEFVHLELEDVRIEGERLGRGEMMEGRATERFRLTQEYTVRVSVPLVQDPRIRQRVVTEYWVAPELTLIGNPLIDLLATVETALAQHDPSFVRRSKAARTSLFSGTPLKLVVRSFSTDRDDEEDEDDDVRTIEISGFERVPVDPASLDVPSGYVQRDEFSWRHTHKKRS